MQQPLMEPFVLSTTVNSSDTPTVAILAPPPEGREVHNARDLEAAGEHFVCYKGCNNDFRLYLTRSNSPLEQGQWSAATQLPNAVNSSNAPSVVAHEGMLYVVYKGTINDPRMYVARSRDEGSTWEMTQFPESVATSAGPTAFFPGPCYVWFTRAPIRTSASSS